MTTTQFDYPGIETSKPPLWRKLKRRALIVLLIWITITATAIITLGPVLLYNATRILRGPETLTADQLADRLEEPTPHPWKIQSLQLPKLPATGSAFGLTRDGADIYDYHYALVGKQLLVMQVEASNATPTTGELRKLTGTTEFWANKQLATVGKDITLASYLFDTTSNVDEKLRGLLTAITFLLVFSLFGMAYALRSLRDPLRKMVGDDRAVDTAYLLSVDSAASEMKWHKTKFVNGQLAYKGPYGFKAVAANEVMWIYYRKRFGHVMELRTTRGQSVAFPLRRAAELEELYRSIHAINPYAYRGVCNDATIAWKLDRRMLGETFRQLQTDPDHFAQYAAEDKLHLTVWRAAALTIARSNAKRSLQLRLRSLFDSRTGVWRKAGACSSIAGIATVTLAVILGGTIQSSAQASPTNWSAEVKPLAEFVEKIRGGTFANVVPVDLLDSTAYDLIAGNAAPEPVDSCPQKKNSTTDPQPVVEVADLCEDGLAPDLRRITFELLGVKYSKPSSAAGDAKKSIGFYNPVDKRLYVRGTNMTDEIRTVLVHELTHAWQDQRFVLSATKPKTVEAQVAWKALVEGDATFVENAYAATLPRTKTRDTSNDDLSTNVAEVSSYDLGQIMPAVFPYTAGAAYIKRLRDSGGIAAVNRIFANPPLRIAETLPYGSKHKVITDLESIPAAPAGSNTTKLETDLFSENLDLLSFYALLAEDQAIPLHVISREFEGASLELRGGVGYMCARLRTRASLYLWTPTFNTTDKIAVVRERNPGDTYDSIQRCVQDLTPGWRTRLKPARQVAQVTESDDGFSLALKVPEALKGELSRWYMSASLAGSTKTTAEMDNCFVETLSNSIDQLRNNDSLSNELLTSAIHDCHMPADSLLDMRW